MQIVFVRPSRLEDAVAEAQIILEEGSLRGLKITGTHIRKSQSGKLYVTLPKPGPWMPDHFAYIQGVDHSDESQQEFARLVIAEYVAFSKESSSEETA